MIGICSLVDEVEDWADPLVAEIKKWEPDMRVAMHVSKPGEGSYAASINTLAKLWLQNPSDPWFIPMNADIQCYGPLQASLDQMPPNKLYGSTINQRDGLHWIDGWIYFISRQVWEEVGEFDENFKIAGFEDADYTWRAIARGIPIAKVLLPFKHFKASPRMRVANFWQIRKENQAYLVKKHNLGEEWSYR